MHLLDVMSLVVVLALVGVEFSVAAFVNPAVVQLPLEPRLQLFSRLARVLGRVMPVWYPVCGVLFLAETWVFWRTPGRAVLLVADAIWILASLASILFLVPLNNRVAAAAPEWQQSQRLWDSRHRVRVAALAAAAALLTYVVAR